MTVMPQPEALQREDPDLAARLAMIAERAQAALSQDEWALVAEDVAEIERLKREKNAIVLAHNYQTRDIYHAVADITGDSLALAREAANVEADVIVMAGVHFMAETAKLMNPSRTVLLPDTRAGCSLAESITAEDVRDLKARYPGVPVVTYVNTSAAVKAESDVCCTSSNARKIVENLDTDRVIMIPDEYLAQNVAAQTNVEVITWRGRCEVHETFSADQVRRVRRQKPETTIIAHPECPPEVIAEADFSGSTSQMQAYITRHKPESVTLITECSMGDNLRRENPRTEFVGACTLCPHMKRIRVDKIGDALRTMQPEITIDGDTAQRARQAVERMIALS